MVEQIKLSVSYAHFKNSYKHLFHSFNLLSFLLTLVTTLIKLRAIFNDLKCVIHVLEATYIYTGPISSGKNILVTQLGLKINLHIKYVHFAQISIQI